MRLPLSSNFQNKSGYKKYLPLWQIFKRLRELKNITQIEILSSLPPPPPPQRESSQPSARLSSGPEHKKSLVVCTF